MPAMLIWYNIVMRNASPCLYIIIPAYNEEQNILDVISQWYPIVEKYGNAASKLVIIDDGSTDGTLDIISKAAKIRPKLLALTKPNSGHGPTVLFGYHYALDHGADYVFQTDSDGQTNPAEFPNFWARRKTHDLVIGQRIARKDGKARVFVSRVLRSVIKQQFGVVTADANTPFRLMSANSLKKVAQDIPEDFFLANVLLTVIYTKDQYRIEYIPISFTSRKAGKNTLNLRRIVKIGCQSLAEFRRASQKLAARVQQPSIKTESNRSHAKASGKPSGRESSPSATLKTFFLNPIVQKIMIAFSLLAVTFLVSESLALAPWHTELVDYDSAVFQYVAVEMEDGAMPYLDTFDHKGPLLYLINYLGRIVHPQIGIWLFEFLALLVTLILSYRIILMMYRKVRPDSTAQRYIALGLTVISIVPLYLSFIMGGNFTEEYSLPLSMLAIYIILDYFENHKITNIRFFSLGILFAAICLLRPNNATWIIWALAVIIDFVRKKKVRELIRGVLLFLCGFLIFTTPVIIWLATKNALPDCINLYVLFNLRYSSHSEYANLFNRTNALAYFLIYSYIPFALTYMGYMIFRKFSFFRCFYLFYFIFSLCVVALPGRTYPHYALNLIPVVIYPLAGLLSDLATNKFCKVLLIYFIPVLALPLWTENLHDFSVVLADSGTTKVSEEILDICQALEENTSPTDPISVYGFFNHIYLICNRKSSTKYSYQTPISAVDPDILDDYYRELESHPPKAIVIYGPTAYERMAEFLSLHNYEKIRPADIIEYSHINNSDMENHDGEVYLLK